MPEYEYRCEACQEEFTVKLSVKEHVKQDRQHEVHCPRCGSTDVKHVIESFYVTTARKS